MSFRFNPCAQTALCAVIIALAGTQAGAAPVAGGATTFTANPQLEGLYESLGISESLIAPASGNFDTDPPMFVLPIIAGDTATELDYAGGVSVSAQGQTVDITNIVMHLAGADAQKVTADLSTHGVSENIAVADISGPNQLAVDPSFAAVIEEAGGPDLSGTPLATFNTQLASAAAPEPAQLGLIAVGLIALGTARMRISRTKTEAR